MIINNKGASIPFFYIPDAAVAIPDFNISTAIDSLGRQWIYWCSNLRWYPEVFLNIKNTDGTWVYVDSQRVIDSSGFPLFGNTHGAVAMGDVLYDSTPIFYNTFDSTYYRFLMYIVYQEETNSTAGALYVSFSNDGLNWTFMRHATIPGGVPYPAYGGACIVAVEAVGAVTDGTTIKIVGVDGDFVEYTEANKGRTLTHLCTASVNDPCTLTLIGEMSATGIFAPNKVSFGAGYCWFPNLGIAYDDVNNYFYIGRSYPYGIDLSGGTTYPVPCHPNCAHGASTYPVRVQVYKMSIATYGDISDILTGTWTLVADLGHKSGYKYNAPPCTPLALQGAQEHINIDLETVSFLRTMCGYLHPNKIAYFASAAKSIDMTQGDCVSGDDGYVGLYKYNLP